LSVADNARDAVLLHVSAASERQEYGNERGTMTKKTERNILDLKLSPYFECCMLNLGNSPVGEFHIRKIRNTLSVPSS
jgi:hypothetical protein